MKKSLYFLLQRLIGSQVSKYYQEFLELEKAGSADLLTLQQERLDTMLRHAVKTTSFYQKRVSSSNNLSLLDFPILTKSDIKNHFTELMTPELQVEFHSNKAISNYRYSWIKVQTGGSTGVPTTGIHDKAYRDRGRAARLYSQYLCGFPISTPYFKLWGSMAEINQMQDSFLQRVMNYLSSSYPLNAFRMNNDHIDNYIALINASSTQYMMAYVDAVYQMAKYSLNTEKKIKSLTSVMACAGTVTDDIRQTIEQVFKTKVYNKYGSRDCADMACECEQGGLHIYTNNVMIEVVDADGVPLPAGESGRILVTLLSNYAFPLIRYEIGDIGALSNRICECSRPFPLLERLEGRSVEFLVSNEGAYVSPIYIRHVIGVIHNPMLIKRFQLIQTSLVDYQLSLEIETGISETLYFDTINNIIRDLKAVFGEKSNIEINKVDEIQPTKSGKFLYTINKISGLEVTKAE